MAERLTAAKAAELHREGQSACQIAAEYGLTRNGTESKIRAAGLAGLAWCPLHRTYEELTNR